jgi:hypothetical protein
LIPIFFKSITDQPVASPRPISSKPYDHDKAFSGYRENLSRRLEAVKREMGERLLCSAHYRPDPRHSLRVEIYCAANEPYRHAIAYRAAQVRENNPAYIAAQAAIRYAVNNYQGASSSVEHERSSKAAG